MINTEGCMMMMMSKGVKNEKNRRIISEIEVHPSFQGIRNSFNKPFPCYERCYCRENTVVCAQNNVGVFKCVKINLDVISFAFETRHICNFINRGKNLRRRIRPWRYGSTIDLSVG
jgi:hypothetical protein